MKNNTLRGGGGELVRNSPASISQTHASRMVNILPNFWKGVNVVEPRKIKNYAYQSGRYEKTSFLRLVLDMG